MQESDVFVIDLQGERVTLRPAEVQQMTMNYGSSSINAETPVHWLDQSLHKALHAPLRGITQAQRRAFLAPVVNHQLHACGVPLVVLAQARF